VNSISVAELAFWREGGFPHTLLDVRRQAKRAEEGVEIDQGAWLDPARWLDWKDTVPATQPAIIYCAHGHEISQGLAATLRAMGVDARSLEGGIEAWQLAGYPVTPLASADL
jgi:rhodanese-related sulfurtransferase